MERKWSERRRKEGGNELMEKGNKRRVRMDSVNGLNSFLYEHLMYLPHKTLSFEVLLFLYYSFFSLGIKELAMAIIQSRHI